MKRTLFFFILLVFILSCGKKEKGDDNFTEFTQKIEQDIQEQFGKKEEAEEVIPEQEKVEEPAEIAYVEKEKIETPPPQQKEPKKKVEKQDILPTEKATGLSVAELWEAYRLARAELETAQAKNDFKNTLTSLQKTTRYAKELKRNDIAAWQLNNIGYYSIEEFKRRTDYDNRMRRLGQLAFGEERRKYYSETKDAFISAYNVLENAIPYLDEAKRFDAEFDEDNRTKVIQNNLLFIENITSMIKE